MTEKQRLDIYAMKQILTGLGTNEHQAKFKAYTKCDWLEIKHKRVGQEIQVTSIIELIHYLDEFHLYQCRLVVDYEVIG